MTAVVRGAACPQAPAWLVLPDPPSDTPARQLVEQALAQAAMLGGGDITTSMVLASGSWRLDVRELRAIALLLGDRGVTLTELRGLNPFTRVAAAAMGLHTSAPPEASTPPVGAAAAGSVSDPTALTVHQGTLRSGDHLEAAGSLLVLGDVNPGARVSAGGHVLVWGRLRGTAHAGFKGDRNARIVALQLRPLQLRIANAVARGPEERPPAGLAEQALLVEGMIRLEAAIPVWPLNG
ncbi:MAG: septum site-determining protein MinC [Cyanobacteriota bacterium]|nr:septum site-determining protein MinC [Cyanobacteriota bacterium]